MEELKHLNINWHYIGKIQTNNISKLVNKFHLLQSVFKDKHLQKINLLSHSTQKILIQVKIESDTRENGVPLKEIHEFIKRNIDLKNINICGLMFLPPPDLEPNELKNIFTSIHHLFNKIKVPKQHSWNTLSMGMSNDYQLALENGATHVRIGRALFGERE